MAKYLIHACPERLWYVNNFLIPSMVRQGIDHKNIFIYIDNKHEGNLIACMKAFQQVELFSDFNEIVWHLQDDVAISSVFKQYTECEYESDIVCAFCTRDRQNVMPGVGLVDTKDMWYSFQCIGIRSEIASGCAYWFENFGKNEPELSKFVSRGLGDDEVFKWYCAEICMGLKALNLIPNLVEHIDFLIGGSTAAKGMPQRRAMYLKDGTQIVEELQRRLKNVQKDKEAN